MGNTVGDMCCKLRSAAQAGQKSECVKLIKLGARVSCQDNLWNSTALHEACRFGHHQVAALLLKHGSAVDAKDCIGHTPLFYAAKGGFECIVQLLLDNGADVNCASTKRKTPLHLAFQHGRRVSALILLVRGADLFAKDQEGLTPIQLAARAGTFGCLMVCHGAMQSSEELRRRSASELLDINDSEIPEHARVILKAWLCSLARGKELQVPPKALLDPTQSEALKSYFTGAAPPASSHKRKRARGASPDKTSAPNSATSSAPQTRPADAPRKQTTAPAAPARMQAMLAGVAGGCLPHHHGDVPGLPAGAAAATALYDEDDDGAETEEEKEEDAQDFMPAVEGAEVVPMRVHAGQCPATPMPLRKRARLRQAVSH